jgi:type III secretory pathway lipoprotein EscJ
MQENTNIAEMTDENAHEMTAYLENLLSRQIARLKQYDIDAAMQLAVESEQISEEISRAAVLDRPGFADRRDRVKSLYQELCLVIASQRQEVMEKREQIRTGMRTLGTYAGK